MTFSEEGTYVGASFDDGKIGAFRNEVAGRLSLARVLALNHIVEWIEAEGRHGFRAAWR